MLHARENHDNFVLDADGYAIPGCDLLADQLAECGIDDPNYGDASHWPWWCDQFTLELGPDPTFDPLPGGDGLDDLRVEF